MGRTVRLEAPAKINLFLGVGGSRSDGYHDVVTVLQSLELADSVAVAGADELTLACDLELGIPPQDNLAYRAALAMGRRFGRDPAVSITLGKAIPAGAGLGGGSSDAAAVVRALAILWDVASEEGALAEVAGSLGADVPFFLGGPLALLTGRGDVVERRLSGPVMHVAVVWPGVGVPTGEAYSALDRSPRRPAPDVAPLLDALEDGDVARTAALLHNDMTDASCGIVPAIRDALALLEGSEGVLGSCMCGSGSAVFGVCASQEGAQAAAAAASRRGWWASATRTR